MKLPADAQPTARAIRWLAVLLCGCAATILHAQPAPASTETAASTATPGETATGPHVALEAAPNRTPDVVFVPTPQRAVERMLELAEIKPGNLLYDLGCGDGRIVVTAAQKHGIKAVGVDIDPKRVAESRANVRSNKVEHLVTILHADIFELDFSDADVVTLYLLPQLNVKLMPQLRKLKPGSRIISYDFDMRGAKPLQVVNVPDGEPDEDMGYSHTIYKWVVPWEAEE